MSNGGPWHAGTSTHLASPNAITGIGTRTFPPNIGFLVPAGATLCRVSAKPDMPQVGNPFELREGYEIQLTANVSDGRSFTTNWTSFGPNGETSTLTDGTVVVNPPPTLVFPVAQGNVVRGVVQSAAIPAMTGIIEWQ